MELKHSNAEIVDGAVLLSQLQGEAVWVTFNPFTASDEFAAALGCGNERI